MTPDRCNILVRCHAVSLRRNRRVSVSLSPTLTLFQTPHGKLYLRLQERVPESASVRLAASTPPKTIASSIAIADAILEATDFSNGYPKQPLQGNTVPFYTPDSSNGMR